jgi:hypothetical protein
MPNKEEINKGLSDLLKSGTVSASKPKARGGISPEHLKLWICTDTGEIGAPKAVTKGSIGIEIILWLFMLVPGLIYSVWRLSTRNPGINGNTNIIKIDTPRGRQLYAQFHG